MVILRCCRLSVWRLSGGKHDRDFIANLLLNPKIKEFWKSANICRSYERIISLVFFDSQWNSTVDVKRSSTETSWPQGPRPGALAALQPWPVLKPSKADHRRRSKPRYCWCRDYRNVESACNLLLKSADEPCSCSRHHWPSINHQHVNSLQPWTNHRVILSQPRRERRRSALPVMSADATHHHSDAVTSITSRHWCTACTFNTGRAPLSYLFAYLLDVPLKLFRVIIQSVHNWIINSRQRIKLSWL